MRLLSRTIALAGAVFLLAAPTAGAAPTPAEEKLAYPVFTAYGQTGRIDPCEFSLEQLQAALEYGQTDVRQYASDFPAAVRDAIAARARGACDEPTPTPTPAVTTAPTTPSSASGGGAPSTAGTGEASAATQGTVVPEPPGPTVLGASAQPTGPDPALERAATASPGSGTPVPLIGLGVLSSLALLTLLMLAALRRLGEVGGPLEPAYHSWREAQWRAGGAWGDFRDWLRLGR